MSQSFENSVADGRVDWRRELNLQDPPAEQGIQQTVLYSK